MITININDISTAAKIENTISDKLQSKEFKQFIRDKCKKELERLTNQGMIGVEYDIATTYPKHNKSRIDKNSVTLYNDSQVDLSNLSSKTIANYPMGLSMSKLVEYGSGIVGETSSAAKYANEDGWSYDINNHGTKGWYYEKDGNIYWSMGIEGKLIYHKLELVVKEKMYSWIEEYLKKITGGR